MSALTTAEAYETLSVSVQVLGPDGVIECEDPVNGYSLHADSFAQSAYVHRTVEVNSPWLEGTYAVDSVLDNTVEALVVWVAGIQDDGSYSQFLFRTRLNALKACFDQLSYTVIRTVGDAIESWDCEVSDYTVETQQEFIFATVGVLRVPLPHRPTVALTQVGSIVPPPAVDDWEAIYLPQILGLNVAFANSSRAAAAGTVLGRWPL